MTRLILIIIFFLAALLTIFKAPAFYLWLLAIGVTEFCWVFAFITIALLLTGFWTSKHQLAGTIVGIIALLLYLSPIVRAYVVSSNLKQSLDDSLHIAPYNGTNAPFSLFKMFSPTDKVGFRTLNYVDYGNVTLSLDFYPSQMLGNKPCVIVVHGGSWSSGDSQQLPELNSYLAKKGYNVAAINYRMAPEWQTPAPVEDIANAIKYLSANTSVLHIDTTKFVLLGRSAGGQIALLAAYTLKDKKIVGVIDYYGPADMVWGYSIPSNPLIMDSRKVMSDYVGGSYQKVPEKYVASSPLEFVGRQSPPTLIIHGKNDVLVAYEHSRRLNEKLQHFGVKHFWLKLPWATHGFDFNLNGPGGQLSTYTTLQFLNSITQ